MAKKSDVPAFGCLNGINVLHASAVIAAPFAATVMAEFGANVVWLENSLGPDIARADTGMTIEQDRRNHRTLSLNLPSPEGREIFYKMLKEYDIFIESSKGGQYAKWGITDEVMWEHNPKLVIVHISGYGQSGDPSYVKRPSYDAIAQAFGCYMQHNGFADRSPVNAMPFTCDYLTSLYAVSSSLAGVINAKRTGKGESIDISQFEVLMRCQLNYPLDDLNFGKKFTREGTHSTFRAGVGVFKCKDGKDAYIYYVGLGVLKKGLPFLGLEYGSEEFPEGVGVVLPGTPGGDLLEKKIQEYCDTKTAEEVDAELNSIGVPCSIIMDYPTAYKNPHYKAREVFLKWKTVDEREIVGVNVVPKFKNNPGRVWRGAPSVGLDNEDILDELGYSEKDIDDLYEKKIITKIKTERKFPW